MSALDLYAYRKKIKSIGAWAGVRMLKNKGVAFEQAYFIMFDRQPKA